MDTTVVDDRDSLRRSTDHLVHRMMLSLLLARSTLDAENQHEQIDGMMDNLSKVLRDQFSETFARLNGPESGRNLVVSNVSEEISEIRQLAQRIAHGMRGKQHD